MTTFYERLQMGVIVFDGAMGTEIHALGPTEQDYRGKLGCSEILNITWPHKIQYIHEQYYEAGADVVETNTFGANTIVLGEYGLEKDCEAINVAAVMNAKIARERFSDGKQRFIAGSMGPGTKIISLGQTNYATMYASYHTQAIGLIKGGVDFFIVETCQDPLQIKTCIHAILDAQDTLRVKLPIGVSITVETNGTLLVGTDIPAVVSILSSYPLAFLGINCATGPENMRPFVQQICQQFCGPVSVMPNAGLPQNIRGKMSYSLSKKNFVSCMQEFIRENGVQIVGGCCGTTPEFISALAQGIENIQIGKRTPVFFPSIASLFTSQTMSQEPRPLFIGERANTNGSKQFRDYLLQGDWDGLTMVAMQQQHDGAHAMDLCVAYVGRDEIADMQSILPRITRQVTLPLVLDSTEIQVLESALQMYPGRAIINSINLENGEDRARKVCMLAKRYGAAVIALTIDEEGMAMSTMRKINIAKRIYTIAVQEIGLQPHDMIFDTLTFTLGSGDPTLRDSAIQTLAAIRQIKQELPNVHTVLGVSNISFGLSPLARETLNSVFLGECVRAGLDMAIVNAKKIKPLCNIPSDDRYVCESLIYNTKVGDPLFALISHFRPKEDSPRKSEKILDILSTAEKIEEHVIKGIRPGLEALLKQKVLVEKTEAIDVINQILIPAMKRVGDFFASGQLQLPFVLQSAEIMKFAVDILKPYMTTRDQQSQTSIVLGTVRGDVHDIGKNLVDIILSNNGYHVYNIGIRCEIGTFLEKVEEVQADAIGMSGLLVKSTIVMKENLEEMQRRSIKIPVLLGGAALTRQYVHEVCGSLLDSPVLYCSDAFEGLQAMKHIQDGTIEEYANAVKSRYSKTTRNMKTLETLPLAPIMIHRDISIPKPPFLGSRIVEDINLDLIFSYITQEVLFRGRWGYRRNSMSLEAYQAMLESKVIPEFEQLKERCKRDKIFIPKVIYGYYPCQSQGNDIIIYHPETKDIWKRFHFPRQKSLPHCCISDFFASVESGIMDIIVLQVATVGERAQKATQELFENHRYKDYLLLHGLSVESAEALAEYWHKQVREELHITEEDGNTISDFVTQKYRGSRYSFGYPACPDMEGNIILFDIVQPSQIGVTVTESGQMVPEQTTSAFIAHHPQAKYFNII